MLEREPGAIATFHFFTFCQNLQLSLAQTQEMTSSSNPNHRSTMRRKSRRTTKTIAAACVLAASAPSGVEAFGQRPAMISSISANGAKRHSSRISSFGGGSTASSTRVARTSSILAKSHRRQTSLGYREGDADQSTAQRAQNERAVASTSTMASLPNPAQQGSDSESKRPRFLSLLTGGRRRRKITARNNHTETEQVNLDEYLEFIDRRYKRMHEDDSGQKVSSVSLRRQASEEGSKKTFGRKSPSDNQEDDNGVSTTMNWLMQSSTNTDDSDCGCDAACQERKRRDALEVLGLAGLASAELLRKHQLPVPEEAAVMPIRTSTTGPSIASSTDVIDVQPTTTASNNSRLSVVDTQHRLIRFTTLLALTIRSILYKTMVTAFSTTKAVLSTLPTLPTKLGEMAGGRKTVKMATAVALGIFCVVVKPLGLLALKAAGGQN